MKIKVSVVLECPDTTGVAELALARDVVERAWRSTGFIPVGRGFKIDKPESIDLHPADRPS